MNNVINSLSTNYVELADALNDGIKKMQQQLIDEQQDQERKAAGWGILLGVLEAVAGVVTCIFTGGAGSLIGLTMLVNGLTKLGASIAAEVDPESGINNKTLQNFMSDGVFGLFDLANQDLGGRIQTAFYLLTMVVSIGEAACGLLAKGGESAASAGINAIRTSLQASKIAQTSLRLLLLGNELTMLVGGLYNLFNENDSDSSKAGVGVANALSMGLFAFCIYEIFHAANVDQLIEDKLGSQWGKLLESSIYMLTSAGALIVHGKLVIKGGATDLALHEGETMLERIKSVVRSLQAALPAINLLTSFNQIDKALQVLAQSMRQKDLNNHNASVKLAQESYKICEDNNKQIQSQQEQQQEPLSRLINNITQQLIVLFRNTAFGIDSTLIENV